MKAKRNLTIELNDMSNDKAPKNSGTPRNSGAVLNPNDLFNEEMFFFAHRGQDHRLNQQKEKLLLMNEDEDDADNNKKGSFELSV